MKTFKMKTLFVGAMTGSFSLPVSSGCSGSCSSCFGCVAVGGILLLMALTRHKFSWSERK